ncbi:hypothetical protein [Flavobacterium sp. KACC 22763]|uniref:hypothetical protein n=1 Tax=Flavobacterium sp. KACC 22763 TaxID=3025668 RepID=UPI002365695D|nr:hypothetical protein [Flavobacterium sp. KACC 22763]WDF66100.1 hypothetical protein PQ463_08020 [Flavobacterium sp. KACC 22763]
MICRNYIVTGEDVNDYMVMEDAAYISYALRLLYHFLFNNGFSKEKLNSMHLGLQEGNHELICHKALMFTQSFSVEMKYCHIGDTINFKSCFSNSNNECCAEVIKEVKWFDPISREVVKTPKQVLSHLPKTKMQLNAALRNQISTNSQT